MSTIPAATRPRLNQRLWARWDRVVGHRHDATPWDEVVQRLRAAEPAAVGFDVFDTLLIRSLPAGVQHLRVLADRLVAAGAWRRDADEYLRARLEAGRALRTGSLREWYRHPALGHAQAELCCTIEYALEAELCRAAPGAQDALDGLRDVDLHVDLVSDMHLPEAVIRALLARDGLLGSTDLLLVSCEVGARKRDGTLFREWAALRGVPVERLAYVGNHPVSDHAVPRSQGVLTIPRRAANLNQHERAFADSSVLGAFVAGASVAGRLARLRQRHDAPASVQGASLAGQAVLAFLLWCRQRGLDDGVEAIAFDGVGAPLAHHLAGSMPAEYWCGVEVLPSDHGCDLERSDRRPARVAVAMVGPAWTDTEPVARTWAQCRCQPAPPSVLPLSFAADDHPLGRRAPATWSFLPPGSAAPPALLAPDEARVWAAATSAATALPRLDLLSPYLHQVEHLARPVDVLLSHTASAVRMSPTPRAGRGPSPTDRWIVT